ncbi:C1q-like domain-containing protein [Methylobacterium sp. SD21]|uniref:C1q-like domain-containing protein n=1 Tax=Methylobacterium litchii TaxID=3138810 RepID=UPI00313C8D19
MADVLELGTQVRNVGGVPIGSQTAAVVEVLAPVTDLSVQAALLALQQALDALDEISLDQISDITLPGKTLVRAIDYAAMRQLLGLRIGVDVQAYDSDLQALAAVAAQPFGLSLLTGADAASVRTLLALGSAASLAAGQANGVATLDAQSKLAASQIPDAILGAVRYQGGWNASSNQPTLPAPSSANKGWYFIVTTAGSASLQGPAGAITDWKVGDWAVSDGTYWEKVDSSDQVVSVAGLQGAITAAALKTALAIAAADITDASANGRSLLTAANYAAMRALLGLAIGTNVQAYDADLDAIASLTTTAFGRGFLTFADLASAQIALDIQPRIDNPKTRILASLSAAQTIPSAAFTKIAFATETSDRDGEYDPATQTWTVKRAGSYNIEIGCQYNPATATGGQIVLVIVKNGAQFKRMFTRYNATTFGTQSVSSAILDLAAGDQVFLQFYADMGATLPNDATQNYLSVTPVVAQYPAS